jgi:adenylate cyclase
MKIKNRKIIAIAAAALIGMAMTGSPALARSGGGLAAATSAASEAPTLALSAPGDRMLNVLFDAEAKAIAGHGGEILKFIGDGLSIFPIEHPSVAGVAARNALAAAMQAVEAARGLTSDPSLVSEPPLEIVVALHIGTAIYGNIGAANWLDFTVIGPAVNLVSRIEAVAKTLNLPIVVSADFAQAYGQPLHPLGRHQLRGLAIPHDLFAPILPSVRI